MPKNKGKGGKARTRGKNEKEGEKRELMFKEHGQEYALVVRMLGGGRIEARCYDGKTRQCKIRGQMMKRCWVNAGDTVLVSLRSFQDAKADVIHKYSAEEARNLVIYGELPATARIGGHGGAAEDKKEEDCAFDFEAI